MFSYIAVTTNDVILHSISLLHLRMQPSILNQLIFLKIQDICLHGLLTTCKKYIYELVLSIGSVN